MAKEHRSRRSRGSLSQAEIVAAAIRILDAEGSEALTFARLGAELQASPTAVYRHFASRHDMICAISDELDAISLAGYEPTDDWRADLRELAHRAWQTANTHPAAAAMGMNLLTGGMSELRAVDCVLRALHVAGVHGREAVVQYQVYVNIVLGSSAAQGALLSSPGLVNPQGVWFRTQVYAPVDPAQYPYADAVMSDLRQIDPSEVFSRTVEMFVTSIERMLEGRELSQSA
ncbi:TetR/AcrR family transcriptional regulator [Arthrobacter sp. ZGTC412]|uniref:TetR/AcrR family transcriptional regulator n=1 Tax=Arthrobacter sp. ZGTC412 TaxID=2058900 RepID=UPI000CE4DAFE|nr:TetR/AcrR family transcriptional regulator [Arthrobacter sp. ZGTC412]